MLCLACAMPGHPLCFECGQSLSFAPPRSVQFEEFRIEVNPVFHHRGAAARLVHNVKYRRSMEAAKFLAHGMARRLPESTEALVPIPRVLFRRVAYGIDQTSVLAAAVSALTGIPVLRCIAAVPWERRSAGRPRSGRTIPTFRSIEPVGQRVVLLDDVCTTGATLVGAAKALSLVHAVALVATSASSMRDRTSDFRPREVA